MPRNRRPGLTRASLFAVFPLLCSCIDSSGLAPASRPLDAHELAPGAAIAAARAEAGWPAGQWWRAFGDPQLDRWMDRALAGSPSLAMAAARVRQAQARAGVVDADEAPQLGLDASLQRKRWPDDAFYGPGDLALANRTTDILDEGYDISVVIAQELPDSGFISKQLGTTYSVLCASPAYIARHGAPRQPSDLTQHRCLRLVNSVMALDKWLFEGPDGQQMISINHTPFQVNTADAMTEALMAGMGIGVLPVYSAVKGLADGSLVRVLPRHSLFPLGIYALYPSRQFLDAKIRTWVEFLRDFLPDRLKADDAVITACSNALPPQP